MLSMLRHAPRFAGQAMKWLVTDPTTKKMLGKGDLALRVGMDGLYGGMTALQTPGDLGDKLIAGASDFGLSSIGGLGAARFAPNPQLGIFMDMAGSMGGSYGGMATGDALMRGKDKIMGGVGETPWEKVGREQQEEQMRQMRAQLANEFGAQPGSPY